VPVSAAGSVAKSGEVTSDGKGAAAWCLANQRRQQTTAARYETRFGDGVLVGGAGWQACSPCFSGGWVEGSGEALVVGKMSH
jgi:hypothetical protein